MKVIKKLNAFDIELTYDGFRQGCNVYIRVIHPDRFFAFYEGDISKVKEELNQLSDDWVEELGHSIHTHINLMSSFFTDEKISFERQYIFY